MIRLFLRVLPVLLCLPSVVVAQSNAPEWTDEAYRGMKYPAEQYYTGYVMDRISHNVSLTDALKSLEDAARSSLVESIVVHIQSDAKQVTQQQSIQSAGKFSEQIVSAYKQQISTSTNAKAAGVEVRSFFDSAMNVGYAFAFVRRDVLGVYYSGQIDLLLQKVESELELVDGLEAVGKKIAASEKCNDIPKYLEDADQFRTLYAAVAGNDETHLQSDRYTALVKRTERKKLDLEQSTRVYVSCIWKCSAYPEYEGQAFVVEDLIKQALSLRDCTIVDDESTADFIMTLSASTSQRSDGNDAYGIISYYANVQGTLKNCRTNKTVAAFSILNDPRVYSAGKNDAVAITKAFKLQALQDVVMEAVMPKIRN